MERFVRLSVAAFLAAILGGKAVAASKCHAVLPSMVPRNMLRGEWKAVLTDVEPLLRSKVTTFDNLVWTSKSIAAEAELISCASKCLQTIYHEYGLHDAGLRVANTSLLWVWRVHGPKVLQDQYMAVKLRHMPSAEVLSPLVNVLSKEHWPPGSDFTMHVLVHLLRNYMSTTKQSRVRIRNRLSMVSAALEQSAPQHASLLRFARDCTTLVDRTPGNPTKQLIAKMRSTRSVSQAAYFRARQGLVAAMLGLDVHKAAVMVGMDPDASTVQALRAMLQHAADLVVPHGCPGQSGCIQALQELEDQAATKLSATVGRLSLERTSQTSSASTLEAKSAPSGSVSQEAHGGWYQDVEELEDSLHPIAGQRREHDSATIGGYPIDGAAVSNPSNLNRPPPTSAPARAADKHKDTMSEQDQDHIRNKDTSFTSHLLHALPPALWLAVGAAFLAAVLIMVQRAADADLQKRAEAVSKKVASIAGQAKKSKRKGKAGGRSAAQAATASPKVGAVSLVESTSTAKNVEATPTDTASSPSTAAGTHGQSRPPAESPDGRPQRSPTVSTMPDKGSNTPKRKGKTARRRKRQNSVNSAASGRSSVPGTPQLATPLAVPEETSPGPSELSLGEGAQSKTTHTDSNSTPLGGAAGSGDVGVSLLKTMQDKGRSPDSPTDDSGGWETVATGGRHSKAASQEFDFPSAVQLADAVGVQPGDCKPGSQPSECGVAESKGSHFVPRSSSSSTIGSTTSNSPTAVHSRQSSHQSSVASSRKASVSGVDHDQCSRLDVASQSVTSAGLGSTDQVARHASEGLASQQSNSPKGGTNEGSAKQVARAQLSPMTKPGKGPTKHPKGTRKRRTQPAAVPGVDSAANAATPQQAGSTKENAAALQNLLAQATSALSAASGSVHDSTTVSATAAGTQHRAGPTVVGKQRGLSPAPVATAAVTDGGAQQLETQASAMAMADDGPTLSLSSMDGVVAVSVDSDSTDSSSPPPAGVCTAGGDVDASASPPVPIAALPVPIAQPQRVLMLYQDHIYCMQNGDFGVGWYRIGTSADKALLAEYLTQQQQAQAVAQQHNMLQAASAHGMLSMSTGAEVAAGTWPHPSSGAGSALPGAIASNTQPNGQTQGQHTTPFKQHSSRAALSPSGPINIPLPGGATLNIGLSTVASSSSIDSRGATSTSLSVNTSGPTVPPPRINSSSSMRSLGHSPNMSAAAASAAAAATLHAAMTRGQYSVAASSSPAHYATHGMSAHSMVSPMHMYQHHMQAASSAQAQAAASLQRSHSGHMLHAAGMQAQAMHAHAMQHAAQLDAAIAAGDGEMRTIRGSSIASDISRRSSTGSRGGTSVSKVTKKVIGLLPVPTDPRHMPMATGPYGPPRVPRPDTTSRAAYAAQVELQQGHPGTRGTHEQLRAHTLLPHMNSPFVAKPVAGDSSTHTTGMEGGRSHGAGKAAQSSKRGKSRASNNTKVH